MPVPNVQWITPADGQRNCPKHVVFRTRINLEICASVGFYCKEITAVSAVKWFALNCPKRPDILYKLPASHLMYACNVRVGLHLSVYIREMSIVG
jgi:hypothetical protein